MGWTLEYEMLLYLIFAASLFLPGWTTRLVFCALVSLAFVPTGINWPVLYEFLAGQLVAMFYLSGRRIKRRLAAGAGRAWHELAAAATGMGKASPVMHLPIFGISATLIVLAIVQMRQSSNRLLILAGDASYSIYLVQVFTIPFVNKLFALVSKAIPASVVVLADILATILAGILVYLLVEKPLTNLTKRLRTGPPVVRPSAVPGAAMPEP